MGHSTRGLDELVGMLSGAGIEAVADIRTVPRSRRNPQFSTDTLSAGLAAAGIRYAWIRNLGGLRHARKDSTNTGWRNASFRGYADHMLTPEFEAGLAEVHALAVRHRVALLCAEAVPWRCHRSLVADAVTVRGAVVEHLLGEGRTQPHRLTAFARVDGYRVTYPDDGERFVTRAPFHLEATVRVLQRRPANPVEIWEDGRYLRALPTGEGLALVEVENRGTIDAPDVRWHLRHGDLSADTHEGIAPRLRRLLGLDVDPEPLERALEVRRRLAPTALALRGMRPPRFDSLFETFANVLPFQQLSLDAGAIIAARIAFRFGDSELVEGRHWQGPAMAQAVAAARLDTLRRCGLSARKAESLRLLARAVASGELSEDAIARLPTPEALRLLTDQPGIGPWSAALVLLRGFGRLDVFPPGDVGASRGLAALMGVPAGPRLERAIERFGSCRGYLYFCALGSDLLRKGLIHPSSATSR